MDGRTLRRGPSGYFDTTPQLPPRIIFDHGIERPRGRDLLLGLNTRGATIFGGIDETPRQHTARIKRRKAAKRARKANR